MPIHPKSPLQSSWTVWLGWLCAVFLAALSASAGARTDFDRIEQLAGVEYGPRAVTTIKDWRALIENSRGQAELVKLDRINDFVNSRIIYASDMQIWGVEDYWTTPLEFFGKGAGDCEDFAIAKYISLLLMDIPVQKLRLVYVRARLGGQTQAHMVLSYYETPTADPLILDNLIDAILPARRRTDLFPVFSFNHEGLWMEGERASSGDPTARLSRWRGVLQRMRREGIDPSLTTLSARSLLSWKQLKSRPSQRHLAQSRPHHSKVAAKANARVQFSLKLVAKSHATPKTKKASAVRFSSTTKTTKTTKTNLKMKTTKTTKTRATKPKPPLRKVAS